MRLRATLLRFGEDSRPDWFGDRVTFAPGSLFTDDHQQVPLLVQHDTARTAAGVATSIYTDGDLVVGEFDLLDTLAGQEAAAELAAGVRWDVSVGVLLEDYTDEVLEDESGPWGPPVRTTVTSADLVEVSLCFRGRMPSARVDDVSTDSPDGSAA